MGNFRNFAVWVIIAMLLFALFNLFQQPGSSTRADSLSYSEFIANVEAGTVRDVTIAGDQITGKLNDGKPFETVTPNDPNLVTTLQREGRQHNCPVRQQSKALSRACCCHGSRSC